MYDRMGLFEWLATPYGIEATHAFIVLILAIAGWIAASARQKIQHMDRKLDNHIRAVNDELRR